MYCQFSSNELLYKFNNQKKGRKEKPEVECSVGFVWFVELGDPQIRLLTVKGEPWSVAARALTYLFIYKARDLDLKGSVYRD